LDAGAGSHFKLDRDLMGANHLEGDFARTSVPRFLERFRRPWSPKTSRTAGALIFPCSGDHNLRKFLAIWSDKDKAGLRELSLGFDGAGCITMLTNRRLT